MMNIHKKRFITASIIATFFWAIFFYAPPYIFSLTLICILLTILCVEWGKIFPQSSLWFWLTMPLYPVLPFTLIIYMNQVPMYHQLVYYLFLIVFSFDTGAYVTGSLWGKNLIAPRITPKKTIEGFIGGYISALVMFLWALYDAKKSIPTKSILTFTLATCTAAFLGDLLESYFKRKANIKDSGDILPGHGGFLDRFDAVIFTALFFFIFRNWLVLFLL